MKIKKTVMAAIVAAVADANVTASCQWTVDLAVPVKDEKGFYILKSK